MRIGIDATILENKQPTGMAVYAQNVVQELARLCDDLVVWVIEDQVLNIPSDLKRPVLQDLRRLKNNLYLARAIWTQACLPKLLLKEKVDIFFSPIPEGILRPPVPQIVVMHDLVPIFYQQDAPLLRRLSFRCRIPGVLANSARVVAVSHFTKNDICRFYKIKEEKVLVVYEGYDNEHFRPQASYDMQVTLSKYNLLEDEYILFLGNFTPRKNIHTLLKAYKILVDKGIDKLLVLAGNRNVSKKYTKEIEELVGKLDIGKRVRFLEYVPYGDLPALYGGASVFVYLSYYEGFGLPVLEAMACETPTLVSTKTAVAEISGGAGVLVDPVRPEHIAANLAGLVEDNELRRNVIDRGLKRIALFRWEKTAREISECFRSIKAL